MYKNLRRKIMVLIVTVLILLWAVTLSIIYFTTYQKITAQNKEMLTRYAEKYWENGSPEGNTLPKLDFYDSISDEESSTENAEGNVRNSPKRFRVSTFFSVAFKNGDTDITNDHRMQFSNEELVQIAEKAIAEGRGYGKVEDMIYLVQEQDETTLVVLMDNTIVGDSMELLIQYMFLVGGCAIVIIMIASYFFSGWLIRPLEENDKRQKQFISDAGHELKTPISTINANMEILQRELGDNIWLSNIQYENQRMEHIVKELLDLAKSQNAQFTFEEVNLSRLVLMQVMPFEASAFEKGLVLDYEVPEDIIYIGNAGLLQRLVSTLIDNAFTHCKKHGKIQVKLKNGKNHIFFSVSNEGNEIPVEERERIFDRFYRADTARSGQEQHYGLGLSIAKSIVERHHGKIYVECQEGWTSFCVELKK